MPANPETRDNSITGESGFASETSKLIRTQSCPFAGRWEMLQAMQLEIKIARKGMGGQGSVMSVLMGSLNDILGNAEKNLLVPFQVGFSAGPTGISSLVPASSSSWGEHAHLPVSTLGCSEPWSPLPLHQVSKSVFPTPLTPALASQVPRRLHLIYFVSCLSSHPSLSPPLPQLLMNSPILT